MFNGGAVLSVSYINNEGSESVLSVSICFYYSQSSFCP